MTHRPVGGASGAGRAVRPHRTLADAPSVRALTHPTRLALIQAIGPGALTATQASALVAESPAACAYHLRTLARLGFLEEAAGGRGRERPWRLARRTAPVASASPDVDAVTRPLRSAMFATAPELRELRAQILALTSRYADRVDPARRPRGAVPVEVVTFIQPLEVTYAAD